MTKKTSYRVTDKGGPRPDIAGERRKVGDVIKLTESEARFELSRGMIESVADEPEPAAEKPAAEIPAEAASTRKPRGN